MPTNVAPSKKSRILELSDGSDEDDPEGDCPPLIEVDDENDDDADDNDDADDDKTEEPEESAEAELGQSLQAVVRLLLRSP